MREDKSARERVAAIILNWQRPDLTLGCLASLSELKGPLPDLYVVDNHSGDASVSLLIEGLKQLAQAQPQRWRYVPDVHDPRPERHRIEDPRSRLILIESSQNLGFGGGINLGLRAALNCPETRFFWVLNNDTRVMPGSLHALRLAFKQNPALGVLGCCLCYLEKPDVIQGVGGRYNPWLGITRHVLGGELYSKVSAGTDRPPIDYVVGAALCIRRAVLEEAGLFPEDYFLYFEDMDWAYTVRKKAPRWETRYSLESVVLHQEGASTGANEAEGKKTNPLADFYYQRNRLRFARRWYPLSYPLVHLSQLLVFLNRIRRRQWSLAGIALGLFIGWVPKALRPPES